LKAKKNSLKKIKKMQVYIINYQKDNKTYKKVVLKIVNELNQETFWYSGFLRDLEAQKSWGKSG
jgi:hypothetical protein